MRYNYPGQMMIYPFEPRTSNLERSRGQVALSLIFLIGGLVIMGAVSLAFMILTFINSGYGYRASNQALSAAQAGVNDAVLLLERNKSYAGTYALTVGSSSASVTVTQNASSGQATVLSTASVSRYTRKLQAVISVDPSTGQVDLLSWAEQAL